MRTFTQVSSLRAFVRAVREDGKTIGFVPTMGALHDGHLALLQRARGDCDIVIASVFVNPTQFGPGEDYTKYPRDLDRDSRLAQQAGVDSLFAPSVEEMYPIGAQTVVSVPSLSARWEGERRPGHFDGVATVCTRLFQITQPDRAYFGRKDYQQLRIIERLVADLAIPLTVVAVPTVRDADGLALSSRNAYLTPEERRAAPVLYRALRTANEQVLAGERSCETLLQKITDVVSEEPLAQLDYAAVVDPGTLEPLETVDFDAVALIAVRVGRARLIDNLALGVPFPNGR